MSAPDPRDLLVLCLPYIEDAAQDPAYKKPKVEKLIREIRKAVFHG